MTVWVVGGTQGRAAGALDRDHEGLYTDGVLAALDGDLRPVLRGLGRCAKGISRAREGLWVSSEDAVRRVVAEQVAETVSEPVFNDVHHAALLSGRLHVASTGADGVWVDGAFHAVVEGVSRPQRDVRGADLKPHRAHPNHLFSAGGRRWVTRGLLGDAWCLDTGEVWPLAEVVVHDGVVVDDAVWFTSVDGHLLRVWAPTGRVEQVVDLNVLDERGGPLGWCRGLAFVDGVAWVGFTQLRATRFRRHLAWARGRLRGAQVASPHPTRLVAYDLRQGRKLTEVPTARAGIDAVFGLLS